MQEYDHQQIEKKWQKYWAENQTFASHVDESKKKYYILDMWPYPSGAGLHIGHAVGYTATDIVARYRRMLGLNVLHPMGWDSFGLPAERYAVRTGTHPAITTKQNIDTYRKQLQSFGYYYDWNREIASSDPEYYKWTQWIFTKLYEKGLAYEAEASVNFCPALGTVLANEEVEGGRATDGGHEVVRMLLKQWVLKITAYADRLLQDLELVDWPESIKTLQRNWIGRSEGVAVDFAIETQVAPDSSLEDERGKQDTSVATKGRLLNLAEEKHEGDCFPQSTSRGNRAQLGFEGLNEALSVYTTRADTLFGTTFMVIAPEHPLVEQITTGDHKQVVEAYVQAARGKSDFERTEVVREKTGVFTGGHCINPVNGEKIPVWVADYVLASYGTGAVMAVPAHDQRDYEFALQYHIPIKEVIRPSGDESAKEGEAFVEDGVLINSSSKELSLDGITSEDAREKLADWLEKQGSGKRTVQYKLRDWLFSRQRYWGEPIPVLHFEDGTKRVLGLDELPLIPPNLDDFAPPGDGTSVLSKAKEWVEVYDEKSNRSAKRETNTMPQWAGSCWYYLRFCDPKNKEASWGKREEKYWLPVDLYVGGAEHAVLHLLYARFWHKVLYDCGLVSHPEPFHCLRNQGLVLSRSFKDRHNKYIEAEDVVEKDGVYRHKETKEVLTTQIEKMSKSKLNGVSPDGIIQEYGADAFRLAVSFIGPLEKEKIWNSEVLNGCRKFLCKAFELVSRNKVSDQENEAVTKLVHRLVAKARQDLEALQLNTLIAKMMEFINEVSFLETLPKQAVEWFVQVLSLYAPHLGEEMWKMLGHDESILLSKFPEPDPQYLVDEVVTYVVQVNGKLRGRLELPRDRSKEELIQLATNHPNVARFLGGAKVQKTVVVPNKLLNFVTA